MAKGAKAEKKVKAGGRKNKNADPEPEPEPIPEVEEPAAGAGDDDGRLSPSGPGAVQSSTGFTIPVPTTTEGPHDYDAKKDEAEEWGGVAGMGDWDVPDQPPSPPPKAASASAASFVNARNKDKANPRFSVTKGAGAGVGAQPPPSIVATSASGANPITSAQPNLGLGPPGGGPHGWRNSPLPGFSKSLASGSAPPAAGAPSSSPREQPQNLSPSMQRGSIMGGGNRSSFQPVPPFVSPLGGPLASGAHAPIPSPKPAQSLMPGGGVGFGFGSGSGSTSFFGAPVTAMGGASSIHSAHNHSDAGGGGGLSGDDRSPAPFVKPLHEFGNGTGGIGAFGRGGGAGAGASVPSLHNKGPPPSSPLAKEVPMDSNFVPSPKPAIATLQGKNGGGFGSLFNNRDRDTSETPGAFSTQTVHGSTTTGAPPIVNDFAMTPASSSKPPKSGKGGFGSLSHHNHNTSDSAGTSTQAVNGSTMTGAPPIVNDFAITPTSTPRTFEPPPTVLEPPPIPVQAHKSAKSSLLGKAVRGKRFGAGAGAAPPPPAPVPVPAPVQNHSPPPNPQNAGFDRGRGSFEEDRPPPVVSLAAINEKPPSPPSIVPSIGMFPPAPAPVPAAPSTSPAQSKSKFSKMLTVPGVGGGKKLRHAPAVPAADDVAAVPVQAWGTSGPDINLAAFNNATNREHEEDAWRNNERHNNVNMNDRWGGGGGDGEDEYEYENDPWGPPAGAVPGLLAAREQAQARMQAQAQAQGGGDNKWGPPMGGMGGFGSAPNNFSPPPPPGAGGWDHAASPPHPHPHPHGPPGRAVKWEDETSQYSAGAGHGHGGGAPSGFGGIGGLGNFGSLGGFGRHQQQQSSPYSQQDHFASEASFGRTKRSSHKRGKSRMSNSDHDEQHAGPSSEPDVVALSSSWGQQGGAWGVGDDDVGSTPRGGAGGLDSNWGAAPQPPPGRLGGWGGDYQDRSPMMPTVTINAARLSGSKTGRTSGFVDSGLDPNNDMNSTVRIEGSNNMALQPALRALYGQHRVAEGRFMWTLPFGHDPRVVWMNNFVERFNYALAAYGFNKFIRTREKGALFVNCDWTREDRPDDPAFDWMSFPESQKTRDRTIQRSIAANNPAKTCIVFMFLLSKSGNSMGIWRRRIAVPEKLQNDYRVQIRNIESDLRDKVYTVKVDPTQRAVDALRDAADAANAAADASMRGSTARPLPDSAVVTINGPSSEKQKKVKKPKKRGFIARWIHWGSDDEVPAKVTKDRR